MAAQVSVGDWNRKGCQSWSEAQSECVAKSARACSGPGRRIGGLTGPEGFQALWDAHTCARLDIPHVGPHWTTTHSSEVNSAADVCSTLRSAGDSLRRSEQLKGEGETLSCVCQM